MNEQDKRAIDILQALGSQPAAPFHERLPALFIRETLDHIGVEAHFDAYGNIIARYKRDSDNAQPALALVAHMDHPAFEIVRSTKDGFIANALGGVPFAAFHKQVPVSVLCENGLHMPATLNGMPKGENDQTTVLVETEHDIRDRMPVPVVFDLPGFDLDGDTIHMLAADDLAGCASILAVLERLTKDNLPAHIYAIFTRAEEVGLIGARLIAQTKVLPEDTLVISLESSPVIPGVFQGEGPVIRTGDAALTFDAEAEQVLVAATEIINATDQGFVFQRKLLSGGTCEATAFALAGYRTTGVAFPLGNYQKATTRITDAAGGVGAENIRLIDYLKGVELLSVAAISVPSRLDTSLHRRMQKVPKKVRDRLEGFEKL